MAGTIILIGFMGAGKTSVGRALERRTGLPLLDTDQLIEEQAGMTISEDTCYMKVVFPLNRFV